jgi:ribosomal protein S18 acetylase RimI-like enzyme
MRSAEEHCEEVGLSSVRLSVLRGNAVARSFYEKHGYAEYEILYRKDI